jgi:hypothetical protein
LGLLALQLPLALGLLPLLLGALRVLLLALRLGLLGGAQLVDGGVQRRHPAGFVLGVNVEALGQVAAGHRLENTDGPSQRLGNEPR